MSEAAAMQQGPLALVCGAGSLPLAVADFVAARGRKVLLFPMRGIAKPDDYAQRQATWVHLGQFGKVERTARAAGCSEMVWIGSLVRPAIWQVRFDWAIIKLIPAIAAAFYGGDDYLLSSIAKLVEARGFRVLGAHDVAPEILVPQGTLGALAPNERDRGDIALGLDYLYATGMFDVGQAVVVANKRVLAVEAAEGTDQMLRRVAEMRANGRVRTPSGTGVLVKAPKRAQDRRFDLPSIGPQTVDGVLRAGLAGIAVAAGQTIVAEPGRFAQAADHAKIFVVGMAARTT